MLELKPQNQGNNYWGKAGQPSNPIVWNQEIFASPKVLHDVRHIRLERRVSWCVNPEGWDPMSHIAGYFHRKTKIATMCLFSGTPKMNKYPTVHRT